MGKEQQRLKAQVLGQAWPCRAGVVGQGTHRAVEGRCPP